MKKPLLIALSALVFASCKKDNSNANTITGKWYITSSSVQEYVNGNIANQQSVNFNHQGYIVFNKDGSGFQDFIQGTTSDPNSNVALDVTEIFNYSYSGSSITMNFPGQTVGTEQVTAFAINGSVTRTSTTLELNVTQEGINNGNDIKIVQVQDFTR